MKLLSGLLQIIGTVQLTLEETGTISREISFLRRVTWRVISGAIMGDNNKSIAQCRGGRRKGGAGEREICSVRVIIRRVYR